jgi:hypothetical protein
MISQILRKILTTLRRSIVNFSTNEAAQTQPSAPVSTTAILDKYVTELPSRELAFKIFEGTWSSIVPGYGLGRSALFEDSRIDFFVNSCGGVKDKKVLELGPLEGGHTYMLARAGAASIKSIESNTTAFLKCLIVQNALQFNADFILGDFRPYLDQCVDKYDLVVASGVLYHMLDPAKLICDMGRVSDAIGIWTHYYDADIVLGREELKRKFDNQAKTARVNGREVISHEYRYLEALQWQGFCGGSAPTSYWLTKESILGVLSDLGFSVAIGEDTKDHPNGPAMTLFAVRQP